MSQGYLIQIIYTLYWNIQVCVYYSRDFAYFLVGYFLVLILVKIDMQEQQVNCGR